MIRTTNPALSEKMFRSVGASTSSEVMTLDGTVNKTILSIVITMVMAYWTYSQPTMTTLFLPSMIGTIILAIALVFKKQWAPAITPAYAAMEGILLGTISLFANLAFPGIAFQAISYTFGVLLALLLLYKSKMIPVTDNFRMGVAAATFGIFLMYLVSWIVSLFGVNVGFLHGSSTLSIGVSIVVIIVAALNLVLDFDFIENASKMSLPKYMEWYAAFGLLVTLVWLYIEILNLLMKLRNRD